MAQGLSTPDPSLSPTHLSIKTGRITTTHYTHYQVRMMVSHNTTLVPSLGLRIGPAAGLSAGIRREHVPPQNKKEKKKEDAYGGTSYLVALKKEWFQEQCEEEAQLSQRGRVMLHVVGNFAQSLKVIQNYIGEYGVNSC